MDAQLHEAWLTEYREICAYHRHEDSTKWTIVGLTSTGAGALVTWTATSAPFMLWLSLALAGGLIWLGAALFEHIHSATRIRLARAQELEASLQMCNHIKIDSHDHKSEAKDGTAYRGGLAMRLVAGAKVLAGTFVVLGLIAIPVTMLAVCFPAGCR